MRVLFGNQQQAMDFRAGLKEITGAEPEGTLVRGRELIIKAQLGQEIQEKIARLLPRAGGRIHG